MRILFLPAPAIGHAYPMVPLAWACRAAGHEVAFAASGDAVAVAQAGLAVLDALPGVTSQQMLFTFVSDAPELFRPFEGDPAADMARRKPSIVAVWDRYVDVHLDAAARFAADLIISDSVFAVGLLAGAVHHVPVISFDVGIVRFGPDLVRELPAGVAFRRHGVAVPDNVQTIGIAPDALADDKPPPGIAMRFVPYNGGAAVPGWAWQPGDRPRIIVSAGSLLPGSAAPELLGRIARIATQVDAEFVVTLGQAGAAAAAGLPANVRVTGWLPLHTILPTTTAVIHHGGDGTTLTCAALGVPQIVVPEGPQRVLNAEITRRRGVARVFSEFPGATAIKALLQDDEARAAAAGLRAEIAALPAPAEVAARLTELF
ncbi:nucleotide disphospho-sugar-binding domain-containing protein [Actinoplanes sp. TFC3]|uniref:nucleotide disphospho-sugar-binding domain-containing protein n=1 Tax=Actinoplanes sp. TFC3 TaxID=1710355 RepID=UPI00082BCF3F|nr:nucleotide disphospho-sugar-binding domain-containing protein [Actinoplanes sp. TFC3]